MKATTLARSVARSRLLRRRTSTKLISTASRHNAATNGVEEASVMPLHLLDWTCDGVDHRRVSVPVAYTEIWIGAAGGLCAASQERRNNLVQLFLRRRRRMGFAS